MPTIPTDEDYGGRPSLRSNRLDLPGTGDLATGEALARAAGTAAEIYGAQKAKTDRLNYSLAKNELITADLLERDKLVDDEDWATYDERYSTGYNAARDEIYSRYRLSRSDAAMLDSESNLIRERGRVQVGEASRVAKLDNERTRIKNGLIDAREQIINLDPATANDLMMTQLDLIQAGVKDGVLDDEEGLAWSQSFVTDTATATLDSMEADDRIKELELSLAKRTAHGAIDEEDIRANKGSGSIADFLPRDVAQDMLDKAREEHKISSIQGVVHGLVDEMTDKYQLNNALSLSTRKKEGRRLLKERYGDDPNYGAMRDAFEREQTMRNNEGVAIDKMALDEIDLAMMNMIQSGLSYDQLPAGALKLLPPEHQNRLRVYAADYQTREGFAAATNPDMAYAWYHMNATEMANANINGTEWRTQFTRDDWNRMIREQEVYRNASKTHKDPNIYRGDPDDEILKSMLIGGPNAVFKKVPSPSDTVEYARWLRIDNAVNKALIDESLRRYEDPKIGSGYLSPDDVQQITARTLGQVVYLDRTLRRDTKTLRPGLTEAEKASDKAYVNIDQVRASPGPDDEDDRPQNAEQWLRNLAGSERGPELSDRQIERAYFLWINGDWDGMIEAISTEPPGSPRLPL